MNRRAAALGCATRATPTRSAWTTRATTPAPRPRQARDPPARATSSSAARRPAERDAAQRRAHARVINRNTLVRRVDGRQRREDRAHAAGRLRARRIGDARRGDGRQRRARRAQRARARRRLARAAALRAEPLRGDHGAARGPRRSARSRCATAATSAVDVIAGETVRRVLRTRHPHDASRSPACRAEVDGPLPRGTRVGTAVVRAAARCWRACRRHRRPVAEAGLGTRLDDGCAIADDHRPRAAARL